jgi:hypothetical protein
MYSFISNCGARLQPWRDKSVACFQGLYFIFPPAQVWAQVGPRHVSYTPTVHFSNLQSLLHCQEDFENPISAPLGSHSSSHYFRQGGVWHYKLNNINWRNAFKWRANFTWPTNNKHMDRYGKCFLKWMRTIQMNNNNSHRHTHGFMGLWRRIVLWMMLGRVKEYTQTSTHGFYVTLKINCSLDDVRSGKGIYTNIDARFLCDFEDELFFGWC